MNDKATSSFSITTREIRGCCKAAVRVIDRIEDVLVTSKQVQDAFELTKRRRHKLSKALRKNLYRQICEAFLLAIGEFERRYDSLNLSWSRKIIREVRLLQRKPSRIFDLESPDPLTLVQMIARRLYRNIRAEDFKLVQVRITTAAMDRCQLLASEFCDGISLWSPLHFSSLRHEVQHLQRKITSRIRSRNLLAGDNASPPLVAEELSVKIVDSSTVEIGSKAKKITAAQYGLIKALIEARPRGLNLDSLNRICGDARGIIRRLRRDPDWEKVVHMAGTTGGRYRVN